MARPTHFPGSAAAAGAAGGPGKHTQVSWALRLTFAGLCSLAGLRYLASTEVAVPKNRSQWGPGPPAGWPGQAQPKHGHLACSSQGTCGVCKALRAHFRPVVPAWELRCSAQGPLRGRPVCSWASHSQLARRMEATEAKPWFLWMTGLAAGAQPPSVGSAVLAAAQMQRTLIQRFQTVSFLKAVGGFYELLQVSQRCWRCEHATLRPDTTLCLARIASCFIGFRL